MIQEAHSDVQPEARKFSPLADEPTIDVSATSDYFSYTSDTSKNEEEITTLHQQIATLETTVKELENSLKEAQQKEFSLKQENTDLKSALSGQKELVERLVKEVSDAKEAAINLAKANAKLTEQVDALIQAKQAPQTPQTPQAPQAKEITKVPSQPPVRYKKSYPPAIKKSELEPPKPVESPSPMWLLD